MKKSLIFGVDSYRHQRLSGCRRDATHMDAFLSVRGYTRLGDLGLDADTATIKRALSDAIASLRQGEELVFYFAGHGVTFPRHGVNHQAICGVDFAWTFATVVTDEDISRALGGLTAGATVTIIADSCFSGGLQPDFLEVFALAQSASFTVRTTVVPAAIADEIRHNDDLGQTQTFPGAIGTPGVLLLSACGAKQVAGEHDFGAGVEGVLTHYLLDHLANGNSNGEPANTTETAVCSSISASYSQRPELHGRNPDRENPLIP